MDTNTPAYAVPAWGADGENVFNLTLDVIKGGLLLESLSLPLDPAKSCVVVGRMAPRCDLVLEHPSISRVHAALQFDASGALYVVDLGSTHGTFVNKKRLPARSKQRLRVGDMVVFGESSRKYAVCGPTELLPEEGSTKRRPRGEGSGAEGRTVPKEEDEGASWGFGEDAEEEGSDEEEEEDRSQRRKEESDLPEYLRGIKEHGKSSYTSRINASDVAEKDQKLMQQLEARIKKLENLETETQRITAKQNNLQGLTEGQEKALERNAARIEILTREIEELEERILSRSAQRQQSKAVSKKTGRGRREMSAYDSDDDDFYDRTAANRKKQGGAVVNKAAKAEVLTAESILARIRSLEEELGEVTATYDRMERVGGSTSGGGGAREEVDALDAYMQSTAADLHTKELARLHTERERVERELSQQRELLAIAMPALHSQSVDPRREVEKKPVATAVIEKPSPSPVAPPPVEIKTVENEPVVRSAPTSPPPPSPVVSATDSPAPQPKKRRLLGPTLPPPPSVASTPSSFSTAVLEGGDRVWVPPKNQTGDGRTALNDKYGY